MHLLMLLWHLLLSTFGILPGPAKSTKTRAAARPRHALGQGLLVEIAAQLGWIKRRPVLVPRRGMGNESQEETPPAESAPDRATSPRLWGSAW